MDLGDLAAAAALAGENRCMDLGDRYVNSDYVKRMLQADQMVLAEKTVVLFTKDGDQQNNLHDMLCMWYELASAESYFRQGDLGLSLKKFLAVEKHYADITEDQFDFHSYCLRKMTLHTYVEMLQFQDRLHSHAYFRKAAAEAISVANAAAEASTKALFVWNQHSTQPVLKYCKHTATIKAIAWSPHLHGLLASGGGTAHRCICFWNTTTNSHLSCMDT